MPETSVERLDITVPSNPYENLCSGALQVLKHVRIAWHPDNIQFELFTDGITNRLLRCHSKEDADDVVLVRVYGEKTELFIDRRAEIENMQLMHQSGLASPFYCAFLNGLCYGYSPGKVLDQATVRDPVVSRLVAEKMAQMHRVRSADLDSSPCLFPLLKKYLKLVPPNAIVHRDCHSQLDECILSVEQLEKEIVCLEEHLSIFSSPVVFCHNDLLLKNILYDEHSGKVTFIDFEYAATNYRAFDIGNHFCEFAGVETYVPRLYPDREFQLCWLKTYLEAYYGSGQVTLHDVQLLYVQVNKFALASHLMWGIWALIQSAHSKLDFDFLGYAKDRIAEYSRRKEEFLSLELPGCDSADGHNGHNGVCNNSVSSDSSEFL